MTLEVRCLECGSRGGYDLFANGCPYCITVLSKPPEISSDLTYVHRLPVIDYIDEFGPVWSDGVRR